MWLTSTPISILLRNASVIGISRSVHKTLLNIAQKFIFKMILHLKPVLIVGAVPLLRLLEGLELIPQ